MEASRPDPKEEDAQNSETLMMKRISDAVESKVADLRLTTIDHTLKLEGRLKDERDRATVASLATKELLEGYALDLRLNDRN